MLTDVVRDCLHRIPNRFELTVIAADRCRQLLDGARPTVDNPDRERMPKIALREIDDGHVIFVGDKWKVDRPGLDDLFKDDPEESKAQASDEEEE